MFVLFIFAIISILLLILSLFITSLDIFVLYMIGFGIIMGIMISFISYYFEDEK